MRIILTAPLTLACLLSLEACDRRSVPSSVKREPTKSPMAQDIEQIEFGVRLAAANKQIEELERKVSALENTPEQLDLDLLTQRVTALETKSSDAMGPVTIIAPVPGQAQVGIAPRASSEIPRARIRAPKLNLPDLEKRTRPATPSDAKAFSSKPQI
jgi:hypothetical protein